MLQNVKKQKKTVCDLTVNSTKYLKFIEVLWGLVNLTPTFSKHIKQHWTNYITYIITSNWVELTHIFKTSGELMFLSQTNLK